MTAANYEAALVGDDRDAYQVLCTRIEDVKLNSLPCLGNLVKPEYGLLFDFKDFPRVV